MFSTLPPPKKKKKKNSTFSVRFIMLSANAFNLDQSKILSFGKALNYFRSTVSLSANTFKLESPKVRSLEKEKKSFVAYWRGHQTSPTVVSLKGRLPQKLQSKSTLSYETVQIHSLFRHGFYKETEIKI